MTLSYLNPMILMTFLMMNANVLAPCADAVGAINNTATITNAILTRISFHLIHQMPLLTIGRDNHILNHNLRQTEPHTHH